MKKTMIVLLIMLLPLGLFAQTSDFTLLESALQTLSNELVEVLPLSAGVGSNYADAYIGQFPHVGFGVTGGFVGIPFRNVESAILQLDPTFNLGDSEGGRAIQMFGVPLPILVADARLGGLLLPFDFGAKIGFIPEDYRQQMTGDIRADFLMLGADVRLNLLNEKDFILFPDISIGGGFSYFRGYVSAANLIDLSSDPMNGVEYISSDFAAGSYVVASNPSLFLGWETKQLDFKLQISKSLLIFEVAVGAAASYGMSTVSTGLETSFLYDADGAGNSMSPTALTQAQKDAINAYYPGLDLSGTSITKTADISGWYYRVFANACIFLAFLQVDVGVVMNPRTQALGGSVAARIKF